MKRIAVMLAAAGGVAHAEPSIATRGRVDVIASGAYTTQAGAEAVAFSLDRAEAGAALVADQRGTGELVVEAVRSAAPASAAGIDGNSIVVRVKRAAIGARHDLGPAVVDGALGLVADPWIAALGDHPLRTLGVALVEEQGLVASSDLGVAVRVEHARAALHLAITNGEGAHQVERNRGKDTSAVVTVRPPLPRALGTLALHAYGRDGSVGPGSTRSHRAGGAVSWRQARAAAGADLVRAWGVGDRPDVTALAAEAWADVHVVDRAGVGARVDRLATRGPGADLVRWRATAALWYAPTRTVRVLGAVQLERADRDAASIAGVPGATDATRFTLTAQGSFEGAP